MKAYVMSGVLATGLLLPAAQIAAHGAPQASAAPQGQQVAQPAGRQDVGRQTARQPAPRSASGRALLGGATPEEKGVWLPANEIPGTLSPIASSPLARQVLAFDFAARNLAAVPFQPWAKALYESREVHELEPHTRCKASGVARQFQTPYGVEFVELPELQRVYIFDVGGPHTFRIIYMDGRTHPTNLTPTYYGHSIGWWEGDTLVAATTGFTEGFWFERRGIPHTEQLRTVERWTRVDHDTLRYELTVDDPGAFTAPWGGAFNMRWEPGVELFEYICQQANYAHELMVGHQESVDRGTTIVP